MVEGAVVEERPITQGALLGATEWRWVCHCGAKGRWTIQSVGAARFGLHRHAQRAHGAEAWDRSYEATPIVRTRA